MDSQANSLCQSVFDFSGQAPDYKPLLKMIGDARFVLLGEASHGTHEFYEYRAQLTRLLIQEKGFTAVAVEADWPDAYEVNKYVRGASDAASAEEALAGFKRFPAWMWRNTDVVEFVNWLREWNDAVNEHTRKAGFYGLDLYSLHTSMEAVLKYLEQVDPEAARRARYRYGCFEQFGEDPQSYGYAAEYQLSESCEREAIEQLVDLRRRAGDYANRDGRIAEDNFFFAEQNARVVKNAEEYYRSMFRGHVESWNLRDQHMTETLEALTSHLSHLTPRPKIIVWAHNSHLGDARATKMGRQGELNVGQLVRERHAADSFNLGFTTYSGWVTAASDWGATAERKRVRPALAESYEAFFHSMMHSLGHSIGKGGFVLPLKSGDLRGLPAARLERAIGVIYRPETERLSHYFEAELARQFDAVIHIDHTTALEPLEYTSEWTSGELPETYPTAI